MKLLAFYLGLHDSNLALYDTGTRELHYVKSERLLGIKRHQANWPFVAEYCLGRNFVPDAVAFSDGNRNGLGSCPTDVAFSPLNDADKCAFKNAKWYNIDHHLAHVLSAWPLVDTKSVQVGVAIDGRGDHERRVSVFDSPATLAPAIYTTDQARICHLFDAIGLRMNLDGHKADFAGKLMGAQAYGTADRDFAKRAIEGAIQDDLFSLMALPSWEGQTIGDAFFSFDNPRFRNWMATTHLILQETVEGLFQGFSKISDCIVYSGGCALNTVINQRLFQRYPHLIVPPHCYDGGISLGCLEALRLLLELEPLNSEGYPFLQSDEDCGSASESTIDRVASALSSGAIVGWIQGRGELGPRALGHRSILMSASSHEAKDTLNARIKHREHWRPFAPAVLHKAQHEYFLDDGFSPFMLRGMDVRKVKASNIPAVVHIDGTSRVQSVDANRTPGCDAFQQLLIAFGDRSGVPLLLNTSFNAGGKPIVGSARDAIEFYENRDLDAIVVGDAYYEK